MVNEKEKKDCCGCRVCELVCPQHAIRMVEDKKGFRYPVIDPSLCNRCGLCDKKCAFNGHYKHFGDNPEVLAVKHRDEQVRKTSTSGGMFVAISDEVLKRSGVVYGAGYGDGFYVCHKRAETKEQRDEFRGSKYVQSDLNNTFLYIKNDLIDNRTVLFSGTPCQVASLNSFLGKDYENLITVDLLCHGTPSNKIWLDYINVIEKTNRRRVVNVNFRDKTDGWHRPKTKIVFEGDQPKKTKGEQAFFQLFIPNFISMPACHNCKFRSFRRPGDITLGDFWGIENGMPDFDDNKGVSLVLVNSLRGKEFIETISKELIIKRSEKKYCAQDQIVEPVPMHPKCERFWREYQKHGMEYVMTKYTDYHPVRTILRKALRRVLRITGIPYKN